MNKIFNLLLFITFFIGISSCNQKLLIARKDSESNVILKMNKKSEAIVKIYLPFIFSIENSSWSGKCFCDIKYLYTNDNRSYSIYLSQNGKEISFNGLKEVPAKSNINYSAITAHYIDLSESTQEQLRPYIDQMLKLDQDTLAIKFVDFKNEHEELLKEITKFDSISIRTLKSDKSWDGERIAIPANW